MMFDRDARRHQLSRVGIAFVAHRIELGGMDDGGGKSDQIGGAKRRNPGIGRVGAVRQIVGEIGIERGPVDQMIFGERLDATARVPRNQAPDISGIAAGSRARHSCSASWQTTAASVAPAESPPTTSLPASMPSEAACGKPNGWPRSRLRRPPGICARAQGDSRPKSGDSRSFAQAPRRRGRASRYCRRPCRRHGRRRSPAAVRSRSWRAHKAGREYRRPDPATAPSIPGNSVTSARANCMIFARDWRRSWVRSGRPGRDRSLGAAAAIMARKRLARGSSGISAPERAARHCGHSIVNPLHGGPARKEILREFGQ